MKYELPMTADEVHRLLLNFALSWSDGYIKQGERISTLEFRVTELEKKLEAAGITEGGS